MADLSHTSNTLNADLRLPWLLTIVAGILLVFYVVLVQHYSLHLHAQFSLPETTRISLRTLCYWLAIITLPVTNLIRHIQLRLNQTMPGSASAKTRYSWTILVSVLLIHSIGLYGVLLFCIGDTQNSLIIFTSLCALGLFLYRPKLAEYQTIVAALAK